LAEGRRVHGLGSLDSFIFEGFRFDLAAGGLFRTNGSGVSEPVALGSRALSLLALFVERPGQLVSKDDIFATAWSGTVVGENNLTVQISALRRVLDRDRTQGSCIQTIPGRGYRFIPTVTRAERPMSDSRIERRLSAILAADVVGYSRLMGEDEAGTLARLRTYRRELIDPKVTEHKGRIFKTIGDGFLAEFASSVDALNCAQETQAGLEKLNAELTPDSRIELRIGIHQGDIVVEDGDIFGDGVNIAARLEGLADPGGICVSARVQEDAAGKLDLVFRDLGEQQLKNIARPIRAYAVEVERRPSLTGNRANSAPRISVVVLPFNNLSNDPEQQYFVDGVTQDLTTDLSRIGGSFVISSNTAFTYKGKSVNAKQIGRELGVRYVLEGSVQRSGKQVRVNAQLIDAETDAHVWAERFVRDIGDLFALQNEVTGRIAIAFNLALVNAEAQRPTESPDVMDYIFRGRAEGLKPPSPDMYGKAIAFFEHALAIDPHSADAQSLLADRLMARALDQMSTSAAEDVARAEGLVGQALATAPNSLLAHHAKAQVLRAQALNLGMWNQCDEAILEYERVLASDPNWIGALKGLASCKLFTGSIEEAVPLAERAMRLSPRDPGIGFWYLQIGRARLLQSRIDEAIVWLEKARNAAPVQPNVRGLLASAYGLKGETERAAAELAEARRLYGAPLSIARMKTGPMGLPKIRGLSEATFFAGLRKAGVPEE
jgi:TolB-like protein/DNA-binding winged helix-turn-helix (wHTH) protein/Flp pilus assembly protein TadD